MSDARGWSFDLLLAVAAAVIIGYGVLVLGWSVFAVMALFWFENVVIGGFSVGRMLITGARIGVAAFVGLIAMAALHGALRDVHRCARCVRRHAVRRWRGRHRRDGGRLIRAAAADARSTARGSRRLSRGRCNRCAAAASFAQWWSSTIAVPTP